MPTRPLPPPDGTRLSEPGLPVQALTGQARDDQRLASHIRRLRGTDPAGHR